MSSRAAARGKAAASSIRLTSRTSKAVATSRASPSRCFLFCRGSRAARSAPIAVATVAIPPTRKPPQARRVSPITERSSAPGNLMGGKLLRRGRGGADRPGRGQRGGDMLVRPERVCPDLRFERFADDAIVHCRSEAEARSVLEAVRGRLAECGLELHATKTRVVYCKDDDRPGEYEHIAFDF